MASLKRGLSLALSGSWGRAPEPGDAEATDFEWQWQAHLHHAAQPSSGSVNSVRDAQATKRPVLDTSVSERIAQVPVRPWEHFFEERRLPKAEGDAGYSVTRRGSNVDSARPWRHFFSDDSVTTQ
jgi:hypothetical protein